MHPSSNVRICGPAPKFNDYHIWKSIMSMDVDEPIGRKKLSSVLGIGEGSTRTILNILLENKYIEIGKSGITLTKEGDEYRGLIFLDAKPIVLHDLTIGMYNCAVLIRHASRRISFGCEERDSAIISGAKGATTLICSNNRLIFPGSDYPVDKDTEKIIRDIFAVRNDDAVFIGTADSYELAECGAISAALNTMGGLRLQKGIKDILSSRSSTGEILSLAFAIHELVGGLPVCAKSRDDLGVRIENGVVIDNAYTGEVLEDVIRTKTCIRKIATSGPYKGIKVVVTPIDLDGKAIAAIGVVDIKEILTSKGPIVTKLSEDKVF